MANLIFTNYAYQATGGTATRTSPARFADIINVKEFGAVGDGVANDTAAFTAWINYLQAVTAQPLAGFMPAGKYRITAPLPLITHPIGIYGAGCEKTWIVLDTAMAGTLFSFSDCWNAGNWPNLGPTVNTAASAAGVTIKDFTVLGNRTAAAQQNAFIFYDHCDEVRMDNVEIFYVNGRGIYAGAILNDTTAYMRESNFYRCKVSWCGRNNTVPAVEFTSQATAGTSDGTNAIVIEDLNIYSPYGPGLWIHNDGTTGGTTRSFLISKLRIEGNSAVPQVSTADLLLIGDTVSTSNTKGIHISDSHLVNAYPGASAFRITAPGGGTVPFNIYFEGNVAIGGGTTGVGLKIDAGRLLYFNLYELAASTGINELVVGPGTLVSGKVYLNGYGQETTWQTSIDPTAKAQLIKPTTIAWP